MTAERDRASRGDVALRGVEDGDLPIFYEHQLDPEATRMAAFPSRERDAFMAHWEKSRANETAIMRTVVWRGEVVGNVVSWEDSGKRMVGYWLGRRYWGKGIASEALSQFLGEVASRPLYALVAKHNVASRRVLEKCGFAQCADDGDELVMKIDAR